MNVRPATNDDLPALIRIGHEFFRFNPLRSHSSIVEDDLRASLSNVMETGVVLVAEFDGAVRGAAAALIGPLYWNTSQLQGLEMFWWLDDEVRGNGNGRVLRSALEDAAKTKGVSFWNMVALEDSMPEAVAKMYEKAGMKCIERVYMKVL